VIKNALEILFIIRDHLGQWWGGTVAAEEWTSRTYPWDTAEVS